MRNPALACAAVALAAFAAGCGGAADEQRPLPIALLNTESSWIAGGPSLNSFVGYRQLTARAELLAQDRRELRELELARIEAAREAEEARAKAEALREYEEAKRRAEELYRQALRKAARQRRVQARRLAAAKRKRARQLAALREKLKVKPGEECELPEVAIYFVCREGMTPLPKDSPLG